jgi:diguanylate cyclase (GGDEF)-like protein
MNETFVFGTLEFWGLTIVALPTSMALAAVALLGYTFGQRTRKSAQAEIDNRRQRELERAARIAWQLENIADRLRRDLAAHHSQVETFKRRLRDASSDGNERSWQQLCTEAETILGPTMQLAQQLSHAYDEIRQQSDALETFTQGRTDPLTGVGNGRALDAQLQVLLSPATRGAAEFVVAMVSLDRDKNATHEGPASPAMLPKLASVIRACIRDTDFVARFGDEEFVIVMPQTNLSGAAVFGDRLRAHVVAQLQATICCGLAMAGPTDDSKSLLVRADSALYSAKAAGPGRLFMHSGTQIREHRAASKRAAASNTQEAGPAAAPAASANAVANPDHDQAAEAAETAVALSVASTS